MPRPRKGANLSQAPRILRAAIARGLASGKKAIDPTGGDFGAGIIRGMALLTRGEALGHGLWCDRIMLRQVAEAINTAPKGIKARFTHPDLSGDGLGKYTGRVKDARLEGDVVRGDLHFSQSAHQTPDGDLARYEMTLAGEDPEAFGNSIAFEQDYEAESKFMIENSQEDEEGRIRFRSPDPENSKNLPHARIAELRAVDAVDEPAANPDGLFHRGDQIARDAELLLGWTLGLSEKKPALVSLDIDPDRAAGFLSRFLARNGLSITDKETGMPLEKFTDGLAGQLSGQLAADKQSRDEEKQRTGEEEGDADKDEGKDKGTKQGQGDFAKLTRYDAADGDDDGTSADGEDTGKDEKLNASGVDGGGHDNEKTKKPAAVEYDDEASDEDDEEFKDPMKNCSAKKAKGLAAGGEAPKGPSPADEAAIQEEKQREADAVAEKSKKKPKEESGVGSPGSEKSAIGPLGDSSHNVGYSQARQEAKRFVDAFGVQGASWFAEGKSFEEAQALHLKALSKENAALKEENEQLKAKADGRRGLSKPLNAGGESTSVSPEQQRLHQNLGGGGLSKFAIGLAEQLARRGNLN